MLNYDNLYTGDFMERLQKAIAASGYCSRRTAEQLIKDGKVIVNGKIVTNMGVKVSGKDEIIIDGNLLYAEEKVYYILNKPREIISSAKDEKNRKTVVDLIETDKRIYPIGRLDYDTTGLIILTNDGNLSNLLMHPKNKIDKTYIAKINGIINGTEINRLKHGVMIDGKKTAPARVKLKKTDKNNHTSMLEITIHEGRNHQIKKMIESVGYEVLKLKREKYAFLTLKGINSGEYRKLTKKEVSLLYEIALNKKDS